MREADADAAVRVLNEEFAKEIEMGAMFPMCAESGLATIAVVGENMKHTPGIAGKLFGTLGRSGISVIACAQGASETNISFVVDSKFLRKALNVLHDSFFLSEYKVLNLFICGVGTVFFGSALNNFGVQELLNCFVKIAPSPRPTKAEEREVNPEESKFTGFVFKITANIDPNHRSCIAFCKVCSGRFERNHPYLHVRLDKTVRFSAATQFMAQRKSTIDEAYPGDIVGLPDNGIFKIGDTLTDGEKLHFRGLPSFSPEMFKYIENDDPMKSKQLEKGINQLMDEGVAQLFVNQFNGRKIIGTVGQLQFEVIQYRLENEYNAKCRWEPVHLYKACWIESDDPAELEAFKKRKYQYMAKDRDGRDVFLADSGYVLSMAQQDFEHVKFHFTSEF